ncbi:MAG TPA: hypothetical protein VG206_21835 [Terriglobia bacterium]|nr:hypothetical protein [Terriglobia bacterium]
MFPANLFVDTGKVERALPLLRDALMTNGNYAAAHWELGYVYRFTGMLEQSVAECERARQLDPLVKANGSVLNTYLYLGQYQKFLESLPVDDSSFILFYRGFGESSISAGVPNRTVRLRWRKARVATPIGISRSWPKGNPKWGCVMIWRKNLPSLRVYSN